nr:hypothetical protein [Cressdnaviricota sp.]
MASVSNTSGYFIIHVITDAYVFKVISVYVKCRAASLFGRPRFHFYSNDTYIDWVY